MVTNRIEFFFFYSMMQAGGGKVNWREIMIVSF